MGGYKQMLRDRMPFNLSLALKWCRAKDRWIEHVYTTIIKRYPQEQRSRMVKVVLGIKQPMTRSEIYHHIRYSELKDVTKEQVNNIPKSALYMDFKDTIGYSNIKDEELYDYWKKVEAWVIWFKEMYKYIENDYQIKKSQGICEPVIKAILKEKYHLDEKLAIYLINTF